MKTAPIAKLKAHLTSYLKQVKAGQEILITERGVPVAKIVPLEGKEKRTTRRYRLARAGHLRLGRGRPRKSLFSPPRGEMVGKTVLTALLEERDQGR